MLMKPLERRVRLTFSQRNIRATPSSRRHTLPGHDSRELAFAEGLEGADGIRDGRYDPFVGSRWQVRKGIATLKVCMRL